MSDLKVIDWSREPARWDASLELFPQSGIGHLHAWGRIIKSAYKMDSAFLAAVQNSQVQGLLPLVFIKSKLFKQALVSMPYLNDGGILSLNPQATCFLWSQAKELMFRENMSYLEFRHTEDLDVGVPPRLEKISMILDLRGGLHDVWEAKLHSNVRNKIRKSKKIGVVVEENVKGLEDFYEMHVMNMQELGSPAHSLLFFEEIIKEFNDKVRLYVARLDGKVIGGKLVCIHGETMYFLWVSSPLKYRKYAAVSLLDWQAIDDALKMGLSFCDFGRSTTGSTHYEFKKKWGAEIKQLYWHIYPPVESDGNNSERASYEKLSNIWRKLPLSVVRFLGPKLRGGLPQ